MHYLEKVKTNGLAIRIPREVWLVVAVLVATVVALAVAIAARS
jgi:hypothetical protein